MSSRDHPDWWRPTGGQNSQDSILERRSLIWNDNGVVAPTAPPAFYTCEEYKGKFFPRGCRGMLEEIQIYCRVAGLDAITLRYSPHPCLGPVGQVTITPLATWAWRGAAVYEMWNYDSLFIWVHECDVGTEWAYDAVLPYDGHHSGTGGRTWSDQAIRPFIRAVLTGETPGDVPVSGVVNTIRIPNTAAETASGIVLGVPHNALTIIATGEGAGTLLEASVSFATSVAPTAGAIPAAVHYSVEIWVDDAHTYTTNNRRICQSEVATSGRNSMGEFYQATVADPAYDTTRLSFRLPIEYRRRIVLRVTQTTGGPVDVGAFLWTNELR